MNWYWFRFAALPVTFGQSSPRYLHSSPCHFHWQRICGVKIGPWFIGAIRGHVASPAADRPEEPTP